jgi:hypothetical protein
MTKIILTLVFVTIQTILFSQVAISYFPFQSILSISTNTEKLLFIDYKIETNNFFSNLNMEFSPKINLKRTEWINYYIGMGLSFNPSNLKADLTITNGYFIDFGIRAKPFVKIRNLQIVFEISPYINKEFKSGNLRTRIGLAWNFTNKSIKKSSHE